MKTAIPWLYGLAAVLVLDIVASRCKKVAIRWLGLPVMLAAYAIGIALFSRLGVWPALAVWWGIGLVTGFSLEFRNTPHASDAEVKRPRQVTIVRGLFAWPITVPLKLLVVLAGAVVIGICNLVFSIDEKLRPNHVPNYRGIEGCREAALSGDARAQFTLGSGYESGQYGLPQDYVESVKWFRKAAEQNDYAAQLRFGIYMAEGKGVEKNVVEGLVWILLSQRVAIRHGAGLLFRDAARQAFNRATAKMTEQQIAQAWVMLESSPLYKEFKDSFDGSDFEPASQKPPPDRKGIDGVGHNA